jgi:hypothetical protein
MRHSGILKKMWLLLLIVWKCGQSNRPHRLAAIVDRCRDHSRGYPQRLPDLKSVHGSKRRNWECFPRFHGYPQLRGGKIDTVVNSNPRCGEREDGCGQPPELCTAARGRKIGHKLSRGGYPLIHGLSTGMWTVFTSPVEPRSGRKNGISRVVSRGF